MTTDGWTEAVVGDRARTVRALSQAEVLTLVLEVSLGCTIRYMVSAQKYLRQRCSLVSMRRLGFLTKCVVVYVPNSDRGGGIRSGEWCL